MIFNKISFFVIIFVTLVNSIEQDLINISSKSTSSNTATINTVDISNQIVRGYLCVKKMNQLYCGSPGDLYPRKNIETYIDENRALIRRMFGENLPPRDVNSPNIDHLNSDDAGNHNSQRSDAETRIRVPRSNSFDEFDDNKIDSCESTVEIVTPYWAANSAGKIRAIVNTQHLQQAIQQEVCRTAQTRRCNKDCSCEQKYKWHRLLAYDPDDDCKGIFMDWFLFPSSCACRCLNIFKE